MSVLLSPPRLAAVLGQLLLFVLLAVFGWTGSGEQNLGPVATVVVGYPLEFRAPPPPSLPRLAIAVALLDLEVEEAEEAELTAGEGQEVPPLRLIRTETCYAERPTSQVAPIRPPADADSRIPVLRLARTTPARGPPNRA